MNETCDYCGPTTRADYEVTQKHGARLTMCAKCGQRNFKAMSARGWTFTPLGRHVSAPQHGRVA